MKKICIITPGTIASNPRVIKEAEALSKSGHKVHLIYTRHVGYLIQEDANILKDHPEWTCDHLDWAGNSLQSKKIKFISGLKRKLSNFVLQTGFYPNVFASILLNRFYFWQLKKAIAQKADLYIAHYPASIPIAAKAAKINGSLYAFDAEDFHRGEHVPSEMIRAITLVENKFLKDASYISAAAPLIAEAYQDLYPAIKIFTLENMFSLNRQVPFIKLNIDTFKFFWFSQTIGPHRGLEEIIPILGLVNHQRIQLTLLGHCSHDFKNNLLELWLKSRLKPDLLVFVDTIPEKDIFQLAAEHHFGLGLETPYSLNRNICLTNKIYTYILSGNHLILSDTRAQKKFHGSYPTTGICINIKNQTEAAAEIFKLLNDTELNIKRRKNYDLGRDTLNFNEHKSILLEQVKKLWD